MHTGKILGVEALIRWQTADKELLLPGQFLPYIENKAISIKLGEWVINAALKQMHDWQKIGVELPVSLNISTYHFLQPNFTKRLTEILDAYPPIPHQLLELELLGLKVLNDLTKMSQTIENCRSKGIQVALDNFGTGSSSLAYLTHFNVNTLKIDQKIVLNMLKQEKAFRVIGSIIDIEKNFNLNVIASGVATEEHGLALMKLGCNIGQGYAISPPLPAKELLSWCKIWRPYPSWLK